LCSALVLRRFHPLAAAVVAGVAAGLPGLTHTAARMHNALGLLYLCVFLVAYVLGAKVEPLPSVVGLAAVVIGVNVSAGALNPFMEVVTVGPWLGGVLVRSRQRAGEELALRGKELAEEQELFAVQSVRDERARIARELHDIVAHCVSLIVVQAGAGQRLVGRDLVAASEAFDSISEAALQAEGEIDRLVEMLGDRSLVLPLLGVAMIDELVSRAKGSGLSITCRCTGDGDALSQRAAEAAYRVVQESLTNALKHAPGAPVDITVGSHDRGVEISIVNGPGRGRGSGLETAGGGHGVASMRERAAACGGSVEAGPTAEGGWAVVMRLPRP
jgi:signal transduction histidine kinase